MEKKCDAQSSRTDRVLREQETLLRKAQAEALAASQKVVRLQKVVDNLRQKSLKELDALLLEIEKGEEGEGPSSPGGSGGTGPSSVPEGSADNLSGSHGEGVLSPTMSSLFEEINNGSLIIDPVLLFGSQAGEFDRD
jgi:hypothetical protein